MSDNNDKDNKEFNKKENNIDDFFAQFDEISNKFEKKPIDEHKNSKSDSVNGDKPFENADFDSYSRSERNKEIKQDTIISKVIDKTIIILAIINDFFINTVGKYFLENREASSDLETGAKMARNSKRKKQKKYKVNFMKLFKFLIGIFIIFILAIGAFTTSVILNSPKIDPNNIYSLLSESSLLYDSEGNIIDSVIAGDHARTNVGFDQLPPDLVNAFVAIEDKTFWEHNGFNYIRIFGAIYESVFSGGKIRGTSTITQQLARNLYLAETKSDYEIKRKISEAYYTIQLESKLEKEQIIEAYLNTIFLGYNSNGVQAASQAYFSKDVSQLSLIESAALASLAKAPDSYSLVKRYDSEGVSPENENIIFKGDNYTYVFNDLSKDRRNLTITFMAQQGYITESEKDEALSINLKDIINPSKESISEFSSYFSDYVISQVISDLQDELNLSYEEAKMVLYNNGLRIYTTLDSRAQKIVESEFANPGNFPGVTNLNKNSSGNIVNSNGGVVLYSFSNYFDESGTFTLLPPEYSIKENGDILIYKGNRLNFYKTQVQGNTDYSVEFKNIYQIIDGKFYNISGGVILIPSEYKERDSEGNLIISSQFLKDYPDFLTLSDNSISVSNKSYTLKQKVIQPQASMVITDPYSGGIRAMVGGRETYGRLLYNRATSPRQPGSSIKPIGVYGPAIQQGAEAAKSSTPQIFNGETSALYGDYWTAASVIDDSPLTLDGKLWPSNWYEGYRGLNTMRVSIEQSINVNAVKVFQEVGASESVDFLKNLGITSIVESGEINDMNAAALALGGMTKGISPLEMSGAYGAFVNKGKYIEPIPYTKIENKRGEIILENKSYENQAMDEDVAFIMTDMLRSTVQSGIGASAGIGTQPVAGKTGTTSDNYDAWFVGFTPQYVGAIWIGNDMNIELTQGSVASSRLFSTIMKQVCSGIPTASFPTASENIISVSVDSKSGLLPSDFSYLDPRSTINTEYFIKGTEPTRVDSLHSTAVICTETGYLATPNCLYKSTIMGTLRPYNIENVQDLKYEIPHFYCYIHNYNNGLYPISPLGGFYTFEGAVLSSDYLPPDNGDSFPNDSIPDWLNP